MNTNRFAGPLGVSIVAILACIIALLVQAPPLLAALTSSAGEGGDESHRVTSLLANHDDERMLIVARSEGRSPFFVPPRPVRAPDPVDVAPQAAPEPQLLDAPGTYAGGLQPQASMGGWVMFKRGNELIYLREGDEKYGTRVVRVNEPWTVTIAWTKPREGHISDRDGEYDLRFWNDTTGLTRPPAGDRLPPGFSTQPRDGGFGTIGGQGGGSTVREEIAQQEGAGPAEIDDEDWDEDAEEDEDDWDEDEDEDPND